MRPHVIEIQRVRELPDDLEPLILESSGLGYGMLNRLQANWQTGANRFAKSGEGLFLARDAGLLVGICGLNQDPYSTLPHMGRGRHLFVSTTSRRRGVGSSLLNSVIALARRSFSVLRVRVADQQGARFYEAFGFVSVTDEPNVTHRLALPSSNVNSDDGRITGR